MVGTARPAPAPAAEDERPRRGALWPFFVFLGLTLFLGLPSSYPFFALAEGDMASVARSFVEGGAAMYLLLLFSFFGALIYAGLGYPYVVMGKIPSSALIIPALLPLVIGILSASWGLVEVNGALDMASPEARMSYAYRGIAMVLHPMILGCLVAASMTSLAGLAAAMLSLAWAKGARRSVAGWIILGVGLVATLAVAATTCVTRVTGAMGIPLGLTALAAVVVIGMGSVMVPAGWREGTARLLLVVACPMSVLLTWLALRSAAVTRWASALDWAAPDQRATLIGHGHEMEGQIDLAGGLLLAVVGLAAIGALAAGGRQVLAGLARFRVSAAVTTVAVIGTAVLGFMLRSGMDDLVEQSDRGDGTYHARRNEGFRPAKSTVRTSGAGGETVTLIVNPDHIWVDDQQVVATKGFAAATTAGQGLRAALERSLDAWEEQNRQRRASYRAEQEEIEDWVNQEPPDDDSAARHKGEEGVMGRQDAKKSDNRYGIKGPADNPDPRVARERAKEYAASQGVLSALGSGEDESDQDPSGGPWAHLLREKGPPPSARWSLEAVNLAVHREVPFATVREVAVLLRGMGFRSARLLVSRAPDRRDDDESLPDILRSSPQDYGTITLLLGPGQCTTGFGMEEVLFLRRSLALMLEITNEGFVLGASGGVLAEGCATAGEVPAGPTVPLREDGSSCTDERGYPAAADRAKRASDGLGPPPCAYDLERLRDCVSRIHEEYPEDRFVILSAAPTVDYQTLVGALDAVRGDDDDSYLGDRGLFDEAFLFVGDGVRRTCAPPGAMARRDTGDDLGIEGEYDDGAAGSSDSLAGGSLKGRRASVPSIRTGTAEVRGSLSKEVIRRYIRRHINQIRSCYEEQLARRPELAGRVNIRFVISPSGAVSTSTVASSTLGNPSVETCVARAVQRIAFPAPEGGGVVIVTYPFMFQSAEP